MRQCSHTFFRRNTKAPRAIRSGAEREASLIQETCRVWVLFWYMIKSHELRAYLQSMWWWSRHFYLHNRPHQWEKPPELSRQKASKVLLYPTPVLTNPCVRHSSSLLTSIPGFDLEGGDAGLSGAILVGGDDPELILHPGVQVCHFYHLHIAVEKGRSWRRHEWLFKLKSC